MTLYRLGALAPTLAPDSYVAPQTTVIGDVQVGARASIWPQAVLRGDSAPIRIGTASNIQDGAVLHADPGYPLQVGEHVTVGHQAMLHGCTVGEGSLIGIQAVVLNGAVIGPNSLVAAGAVVTEGKVFPPRSLILGAPAKAVRTLSDAEVAHLQASADAYADKAAHYRASLVALA